MKKAQRKKWLGLVILGKYDCDPWWKDEPDEDNDWLDDTVCVLCSFCKYNASYYDELYCDHPLEQVSDPDRHHSPLVSAYEGGDCWGFRNAEPFTRYARIYMVTAAEAELAYDSEQERSSKCIGS